MPSVVGLISSRKGESIFPASNFCCVGHGFLGKLNSTDCPSMGASPRGLADQSCSEFSTWNCNPSQFRVRRKGLHQQIAGSDDAIISLSLTKDELVIDYRAPDLSRGRVKVYVALGTQRAIGSAVIPFGQNLEGSTVFLPFKADLFFAVDYGSETDVCSTRLWEKWKWSEPTIKDDVKVRGARKVIVRIPRSHLGDSAKLNLTVYAKDLSENDGWGRFFGCIDPSVTAGHGDKYIPHYYEMDLQAKRAPFAKARGRLGIESSARFASTNCSSGSSAIRTRRGSQTVHSRKMVSANSTISTTRP